MFLNTINYNAFGKLDEEDDAKEVWSPPKLTPKEIFLHFYKPEDDKRDMQQVIARKKRAEEKIEKERIQNRLKNQPISGESPMDISEESPIESVIESQEQDALEICSWLILKKKNDLTENEVAFVHAKLDEYGVEYDEEETDPLVLCDALLDKFMDPKGTMRKDQKKNKIPIANQIYMKHQQKDFIKSKRAEIKIEMNNKIRTLPGCVRTAERFQSEFYNMVVNKELIGSNIILHQSLFEAVFPSEQIYKNPIIELKNGNGVAAYVRLINYHNEDEHIVQVSKDVYDNLVLRKQNGKKGKEVLMRVCDSLPRLKHISMVFFGTDQERLELESAIQEQIPEQLSKLASVQLGMEFPVIAKNGDTLSVMVVRLKGEFPLKKATNEQMKELFKHLDTFDLPEKNRYNEDETTDQNLKSIQEFIDAGYDLNHVHVKSSGNDTTPLLTAIDNSNSTIVKLLIDAGADVNFKAPLDKALGDEEMVKMLLEAGAYPRRNIGVRNQKIINLLEDARNNPRPIIQRKLPEAEIFAGYIPVGEQTIPFEILKANPYLKDMYKLEDLNKVEVPKMTIWETLERMSPYTMLELRGKQEQVLTNDERENMDYDQEQEAIRMRIDAGKANEEFSFFVTLIGLTLAKYRLFELLDTPGFYHVFIPTNEGIEQFLRDNNLEIETLSEKFLVDFVGSHITKDIDNISAYVKDVNSVKKKRKTADQEIMAQRQCRDVNTLNNTTAEICIIDDDDSQLTYGGQRITNFISCSNGGIHVLEYPFVRNKRR